MAVLTSSFVLDLVSVLVSLICVVLAFYKWSLTYWKRRGMPDYAASIPFGSVGDLVKQKVCNGEQFKIYYDYFKSKGLKHGGIYNFAFPTYVPCDLDIIKHILIKDFNNFVNRGFYVNPETDPLNSNLLFLEDHPWRRLRTKLSPTFTTGKIKMMYRTMLDCTKALEKVLAQSEASTEPTELKDIVARFTTDIIGSVGFGIECNTLENPDASFRKFGKRIFNNSGKEALKLLATFFIPTKFMKAIKFSVSKPDVVSYCMNLVEKTVTHREKNHIVRKDFLHLLIQLKNRGVISDDDDSAESIVNDDSNVESKLTMVDVAAQVLVFFAAGFETSSTAASFALFELSRNQDIQDKLRKEINNVLAKHNGECSYDAIQEMKYLDQVMNESLRMYPPLTFLSRVTINDYKIPGTSESLEAGTRVIIPVLGIHRDEKYYPNPEKFDPERFNEENRSKIPNFAFLPFGDGPRVCIAMRFGYLQSKIALVTIIKNYKITLNQKTILPLKYLATSIVLCPNTPVWYDLEKA